MTNYKWYTFEYHYKFKKEFEKIINKNECPSFKTDFKLLYDALIMKLMESKNFSPNLCMRMSGLEKNVTIPAFIIKKFRCKKINKGSRSGFRITFLFSHDQNKFIFVEIFKKNEKKIPDKKRINDLFIKPVKIHDELYDDEEKYLAEID